MISILLIEDHEIVREGIEHLLQKAGGFRLIGSTSTGKEGIQIARDQHPDVVVLDFELPDTNGLEVIRKLLQYRPQTKILIITANKNDSVALKLLEAGAAGYLSKDQGFHELDRAIRTIQLGQPYISSDMASTLALRKVKTKGGTPFDKLSPKEMEVSILIANGIDVEAVAEHLHLAVKTIHSYRYRIFDKLKIKTDLELLRLALKYGVIEIDKVEPEPPSEKTAPRTKR